ncbi:hypothetical protein ABTE09_21235, partial [Acinetobacter baumannii]
MGIAHAAAHRQHFLFQFVHIARLAQYTLTQCLETLADGGITMLSGFACRRHIASGALVPLLTDWTIEGSDA